jgi:hypothetical protein
MKTLCIKKLKINEHLIFYQDEIYSLDEFDKYVMDNNFESGSECISYGVRYSQVKDYFKNLKNNN